jgi:hypothetical protein
LKQYTDTSSLQSLSSFAIATAPVNSIIHARHRINNASTLVSHRSTTAMQSISQFLASSRLAVRAVAAPTTANETTTGSSDATINILIAMLSLVFFALLLAAILLVLRRMRQRSRLVAGNSPVLPQYHDRNHRRLTIQTADGRRSVLVFDGAGQPMLQNPRSPPHSPENVPEIHITFPDEHDEQGRRVSGRVVVVRVGDNAAVGMEPLREEEQLPAYEKDSKTQFYSIDIDKIGGLKEKDRSDFH